MCSSGFGAAKKLPLCSRFVFFCPTMHGQQPNPQVLTTLLLQQDEPSPTSSPERHLWATDVTPLCKGNLQPKITSPVAQKVLIFHLSSQFCGVSFFFSFFSGQGVVCMPALHLFAFFPLICCRSSLTRSSRLLDTPNPP